MFYQELTICTQTTDALLPLKSRWLIYTPPPKKRTNVPPKNTSSIVWTQYLGFAKKKKGGVGGSILLLLIRCKQKLYKAYKGSLLPRFLFCQFVVWIINYSQMIHTGICVLTPPNWKGTLNLTFKTS